MSELHVYKCQQCGDKITTVMPDYTCCGGPIVEICPLPRVGSKEWGWEATDIDIETREYRSKHTSMRVVAITDLMHSGDTSYQIDDGSCVDYIADLPTAERIAELLARLDWKRENRGKNVRHP